MVSQNYITFIQIFESSNDKREKEGEKKRKREREKKATRKAAGSLQECTNLEVDKKDHCHRVCRKVMDE